MIAFVAVSAQKRANHRNNVILILIGHSRIQGKADIFPECLSGPGKLLWGQMVSIAPIWVKVQGYEVHAGADSRSRHLVNEFVSGKRAVIAQPNRV